MTQFIYKLIKHRWCAWDLNRWQQDGSRRWIHWAMAALRKQHVFVNFVPTVFFNAVAGKVGLMGKQLFLFPFLFPFIYFVCCRKKKNSFLCTRCSVQWGIHSSLRPVRMSQHRSIEWLRPHRNNSGGSPGLVVMGGDSCSEGRGFESQHSILDGHLFVVKIVMFVWKDEKKRKRVRGWPIF